MFSLTKVNPGQRAHLLAISGSEKKTKYIMKILENQTRALKHRWTKISPDPRFPSDERDTPIFALGATKPLLARDSNFYTTVLSAWATQIAQAYQQIELGAELTRSHHDNFLNDVINSKVGSPYPTLAGNFGKLKIIFEKLCDK